MQRAAADGLQQAMEASAERLQTRAQLGRENNELLAVDEQPARRLHFHHAEQREGTARRVAWCRARRCMQ